MKTALVIGCAAGVFDDIKAALALFAPDIIIATNDVGADYERVDHWATCHVEDFPRWLEARAAKGYDAPLQLWTDEAKRGQLPADLASLVTGFAPYWEGTSGALAIDVARMLGADHIVLAGIPIEEGPHYFDDAPFNMAPYYQIQWTNNSANLGDVRSMSGWTSKLLGLPTKEWISPAPAASPPAPSKKATAATAADGEPDEVLS